MNLKNKTFSFEFFPPKTPAGVESLRTTYTALNHFKPDFFSVTYGASGGTRERTIQTVLELQEKNLPITPHISCIGTSKQDILDLLKLYQNKGIKRLVVLRGDIPVEEPDCVQELKYANELVSFVCEQTGHYFSIEVAAYPEFHPQAKSPAADLRNFKRKVDAGANSALTQYFFNIEAFERFLESCAKVGITIPIIPGIMPITDIDQLVRFSGFCGADIPVWLRKRLEEYRHQPESLVALGIEVVTRLCEQLLALGVPSLHFYTLNRLEPTRTIVDLLYLSHVHDFPRLSGDFANVYDTHSKEAAS